MNTEKFIKEITRFQTGYLLTVRTEDLKTKEKKFEPFGLWNDSVQDLKVDTTQHHYFGAFSRLKRHYGTGEKEICLKGQAGFIWADIDDISPTDAKDKITASGLPLPTWIINTGGGVHIYYMLDAPEKKKKLLNLSKALVIRLGADANAVKSTQILRLPGCFNIKRDKKCEIAEYNGNYYPILELQNKLQGELDRLPIQDTGETLAALKGYSNAEFYKVAESVKSKCMGFCTAKMIDGVSEGTRNFALGRIVAELKRQGYQKDYALKFCLAWNEQNTPPEDAGAIARSFWGYWKMDYKLLGCAMVGANTELLKGRLLPFCDYENCRRGYKEDTPEEQEQIYLPTQDEEQSRTGINNKIFETFASEKPGEISLLGLLRIHKDGLNKEQLKKMTGKEWRYIRNNLNNLQKKKRIEIVKTGKDTYYRYSFYNSFGTGETVINGLFLRLYFEGVITGAKLKVYLLLLHNWQTNKTASQTELAKKCGITRISVNRQIKSLSEKQYITIRKIENFKGCIVNGYHFPYENK